MILDQLNAAQMPSPGLHSVPLFMGDRPSVLASSALAQQAYSGIFC